MKNKSEEKSNGVEKIVQVASTLSIEEIPISPDIVQNLMAVSRNEKTIDDCIKELDEFYAG